MSLRVLASLGSLWNNAGSQAGIGGMTPPSFLFLRGRARANGVAAMSQHPLGQRGL